MTHPDEPLPPGEASPWWTRWWGALLLGLASWLLVAPAVLIAALYATFPGEVLQGTSRATGSSVPTVVRVLAVLVAVVLMAWPVLTVRWCLKKWGGWMLVGIGGSVLAFFISLFPLGVL